MGRTAERKSNPMPDKPVTGYAARLDLFIARCALDTLRTRKTLAEVDNPPPFYQPVEKDIEHIEAALKTLGSYVAQQDPDGEMELLGQRRPPKA